MKKLTFREYVESKTQLLKAVENCPERIAVYDVKKYCKLPVGETKEEKQDISLKPKQQIIVKWKYLNETPDPISIKVERVKEICSDEDFSTFWKSDRLIKWLNRNTSEVTPENK